LYQVEN